jgi:DNA-binding CsgD family transcriptional regulator
MHFMAIAHVGLGSPNDSTRIPRESVEILAETGHYDLADAYAATSLLRVDLLANLHRPEQVDALIRRGEDLDLLCNVRLERETESKSLEYAYGRFLRGEWDYLRNQLPDPDSLRHQQLPQIMKDIAHNIASELAVAEGRLDQAEHYLAYIAPSPHTGLGDHSYQQWLVAVDRTIALSIDAGKLDAADVWIRSVQAALMERQHVPGSLMLELAQAKLLVKTGNNVSALRLAGDAVERGQTTSNVIVVINGLRVMSDALMRSGDVSAAVRAASDAHAEATRCRLPYESALALLVRAEIGIASPATASQAMTDLEHVREIVERLGARAALARCDELAASARRFKSARPANVTGRELEVLRLLGTELSGPEVANELMVSLSTMRTHTRNIYNKLGVDNRRAAVRRAEELHLL